MGRHPRCAGNARKPNKNQASNGHSLQSSNNAEDRGSPRVLPLVEKCGPCGTVAPVHFLINLGGVAPSRVPPTQNKQAGEPLFATYDVMPITCMVDRPLHTQFVKYPVSATD